MNKDLKYRLFVAKNGSLRIIMEELDNNMVRSIDVSNMKIDGLIVTDDLKGYFTGHGNLGNYRNKVKFTD